MNKVFYNTFLKLLRIANYEVDNKLAEKMLLSHPSFPSLEAFSETLSFFNIPHETYTANYELINNIKDEAILLHFQIEEGRFVILLNINENGVTVFDGEKNKVEYIEKKIFLDKWSTVTLSIKKASPSKRNNLKYELKNIKWEWIFIFFFCLLLLFRLFVYGKQYLLLLLINLLGIFVVSFIVSHELNIKNKILDEVCKKKKQLDCDAVLTSSVSKIFGTISLGDIGIVYYLGGFLYCLFLPLINAPQNYLLTIYYLSICTLPYTFFSLYYQKFKVKKWCPFCIATIFLLWIIFFCYSIYIDSYQFVTVENLYYSFLWFDLVGILWFLIKSNIAFKRKKTIEEINYMALKRNPVVVSALFKSQNSFEMNFTQEELVIGNLSSTLIITTLISEKCKYCRELLKIMIDLVELKQYDFKWIIRFDGIYDENWIEKNANFADQKLTVRKTFKNNLSVMVAFYNILNLNTVIHTYGDGFTAKNSMNNNTRALFIGIMY